MTRGVPPLKQWHARCWQKYISVTVPKCSALDALLSRNPWQLKLSAGSPLSHVGRTSSSNLCLQFSQTCLRFSTNSAKLSFSLLNFLFSHLPHRSTFCFRGSHSIHSSFSLLHPLVPLMFLFPRCLARCFLCATMDTTPLFFLMVHVLALNERDAASNISFRHSSVPLGQTHFHILFRVNVLLFSLPVTSADPTEV